MPDQPANHADAESSRLRATATAAARDQLTDDRALARFDVFLFSAVATVLVVRAALAITGYPQVGGGGLHIAHVLWGGLLMAVAIVGLLIVPGSRSALVAAFLGGIGFGLFIDEVGKFLTKDVDYFFKPAVAIIYATFVAFYIVVRAVIRARKLSDRRRLALGQLDRHGRDRALALLDGVDATSGLSEAAAALRQALTSQRPARPGVEARLTALVDGFQDGVRRLLSTRVVRVVVLGLFVVQAIDIVLNVVLAVIKPNGSSLTRTLLDTGLPSLVSGALILVGVILLFTGHGRRATELLEWAVLIDLMFTQVVVFNRQQWLGLVGFGVSLVVLGTLRLTGLSYDDALSEASPAATAS
jgi:hypothetical protein